MMKGLAALALIATLALARNAAPASDLLTRMAALNPNLHAFTATLHARVSMKTFPFLTANLIGTYYYKEPDKTKVAFSKGIPIPGVASQFDTLYAHIENPSRWPHVYVVTVVSDDGKATVFKLTPRKQGNVEHIDATVDDKRATVTSMRWNYANGGYAEMTNSYGRVQGNLLVESQTGHVDEPGYVADLASTIDNYTINPTLPDSVFSQ
jgi:outer membrane lipoprotein-sorting protein